MNTSQAAPGALPHRLQRRTTCKIENGRQGAQKWPTTGMERGQTQGHSKQLLLNRFFDQSTPSMRKGHDGEWKKKWKIMCQYSLPLLIWEKLEIL